MNICYEETLVLGRREPTVWRCPFQGRKRNCRLFILVMRNTRDIAQSKAKDFADSPQTHFSAQIKWRANVGLGTRLITDVYLYCIPTMNMGVHCGCVHSSSCLVVQFVPLFSGSSSFPGSSMRTYTPLNTSTLGRAMIWSLWTGWRSTPITLRPSTAILFSPI